MRIMLDTNVLISMFAFSSKTMNSLKLNLSQKHEIVIATYTIYELKVVVKRKFPDKRNYIDEFFQSFPYTISYTPEYIDKTKYPNIRDEFDLPILVSSILEEVDILITGDKDFQDIEIEKPEILTPMQFLNKYC